MFLQLTKADAAQRMIWASIDETPDRSGEVFDYETSKPYFEQWSAEIEKASGGKSLGNIRAQHGKVAAGKVVSIDYDDAGKAIHLAAKIIDDDEWVKVEEGVYTGISPGGRYVKRWRDGKYQRYTAEPYEVSIVDLPCIPSASFTMVKSDGAMEKREFSAKERERAARSGAAMDDGSFPIQTKQDLRNAIRAYGRAKNKAAVKRHIIARARALGAMDLIPDDWKKKEAALVADPNSADALSKKGTEPANADDLVPDAALTERLSGEQLVDTEAAAADAAAEVGAEAEAAPAAEAAAAEGDEPEAGEADPATAEGVETPAEGEAEAEPAASAEASPNSEAADADANTAEADAEVEAAKETAASADPIAAAAEAAQSALKAATGAVDRLQRAVAPDTAPPAALAAGLELRKGMCEVSRLGYLLSELAYVLAYAKQEAAYEGDNSPVPAKLRGALAALAEAYRAMSDEELSELLAGADQEAGTMMLAAGKGDLAKTVEVKIEADTGATAEALAKAADDLAKASDRIAALEGERDALLKTTGDLTAGLEALGKRVEELAAVPLPAKTFQNAAAAATVVAIEKAADTAGTPAAAARPADPLTKAVQVVEATPAADPGPSAEDVQKALDAMTPEARATLLMKAALSNPRPVGHGGVIVPPTVGAGFVR